MYASLMKSNKFKYSGGEGEKLRHFQYDLFIREKFPTWRLNVR